MKYEKKVGDIDDVFLVERVDMKKDGEGDFCLMVEGVEKKRGVEYEKCFVLGWEYEYK